MNDVDENKQYDVVKQHMTEVDESSQIFEKTINMGASICDMVPSLVATYERLNLANMKLNQELEIFKATSASHLEKFRELRQGAELRLNQQLNMVDRLTDRLLELHPDFSDEKSLQAQQTIMNLIEMANNRFSDELEKLYSF